jgi:Kef-type K+ transport system membrane component KefB
MGISMSVTAFPVLARILTDRKLENSPLGRLALGCAAVDDVTTWCLLAFVVGFLQSRLDSAFLTCVLVLGYIAIMLFIVRPLLKRVVALAERNSRWQSDIMALVFVLLLFSSIATEAIGIHALFGAFLLGVIIPAQSQLAHQLTQPIKHFVVVVLLPSFFAFTGMRTQLALVAGAEQWLFCGAIIVVACAGKFGGSALAARSAGLPWRESAAIGILMNTRGLMELIVLNIGLDMKVISPRLFVMLVIMAVLTTMATTPVLMWLRRKSDAPVEDGTVAVAPASGAVAAPK